MIWPVSDPLCRVTPNIGAVIEVEPRPRIVPNADQATATIRNMGCVRIGKEELADLESLGLYVRSVGTLQISQGKLLINGQKLNTAIQVMTEALSRLGEKAQKTKNDFVSMARLSDSLARLYAQQTEMQRLLVEIETLSPMEYLPEVRVQAFEPGKPVQLPEHMQVH
jgi:hypothetical protein